jgi:tRNA G37 N-methylase Trm5
LFAKAGAKITAVDITKKAIELTKKNSRLQKLKITAIQKDAENLKFKSNSFRDKSLWAIQSQISLLIVRSHRYSVISGRV